MRMRRVPDCYLCGAPGRRLYQGLTEREFGVPGTWAFSHCPRPDCRLVWLDPVPIEEDIVQAYETYYTHADGPAPAPALGWSRRAYWALYERVRGGYLQVALGHRRAVGAPWQRILAPLAWALPGGPDVMAATAGYLPAPPPGGRVLDVGCGGGVELDNLRRLGWETEGVDFDPAAVAAARARGLTVHLGTVAEQSFPDGRFDAILMSHVIEHLHDPVGVLVECRRILKPGGRLVIVAPNAAGLGHGLFGSDWAFLDPPGHVMHFSPATLRRVVERAGLRPLGAVTSPRFAKWLYQTSGAIRRTGRVWDPAAGRLTRMGDLAGGLLFQLVERGLIGVGYQAGEEIRLTATR